MTMFKGFHKSVRMKAPRGMLSGVSRSISRYARQKSSYMNSSFAPGTKKKSGNPFDRNQTVYETLFSPGEGYRRVKGNWVDETDYKNSRR